MNNIRLLSKLISIAIASNLVGLLTSVTATETMELNLSLERLSQLPDRETSLS